MAKRIRLRVFGNVTREGRQTLSIQVDFRRSGRRYGIGVELSGDDDSYLPLAYRNRRLVRLAWQQLRGFLRTERVRPSPLQSIVINGTVTI